MKLTESEIRRMIRSAILNEYAGAWSDFRKMTWKDCNVDLPDRLFGNNKIAVEKAQAAATLAAKVYGFKAFCPTFNAIFGDDPKNRSRKGSRDDQPSSSTVDLSPAYFISLNEDLTGRSAAFIKNITDKQDDSDPAVLIGAITSDDTSYDQLTSEINAQTGIEPQSAGEKIIQLMIDETGLSNKRKYRKQLQAKISEQKDANLDDFTITQQIIDESLEMIRLIARRNSLERSLRGKYEADSNVESKYSLWLGKLDQPIV